MVPLHSWLPGKCLCPNAMNMLLSIVFSEHNRLFTMIIIHHKLLIDDSLTAELLEAFLRERKTLFVFSIQSTAGSINSRVTEIHYSCFSIVPQSITI